MKIGFIGCGNMASAIIGGIISSQVITAEDINIYDVYSPACEKISSTSPVKICKNEAEVVESSDIVILAVKPNVIKDVLTKIDRYVENYNPLLISIAAGKTIEYLESCLTSSAKIVRVMPNINAKVKEAISAYCYNSSVTKEDISNVEMILNSFGTSIYVKEADFSIFSAIGGCSPAFTFMFIDAIARAGVKYGLKRDDALRIAAQTVYGSAKTILESSEHPYKLVDSVCSPGGTTIEGVTSLQADGFENAVHNAVKKSFEKDKML